MSTKIYFSAFILAFYSFYSVAIGMHSIREYTQADLDVIAHIKKIALAGNTNDLSLEIDKNYISLLNDELELSEIVKNINTIMLKIILSDNPAEWKTRRLEILKETKEGEEEKFADKIRASKLKNAELYAEMKKLEL